MASARDPVSVILKLMMKNHKKLTDAREIFEVISNRMGVLDNPQELVAFLGQHLKPKELEKKQNGEVFTPPDLIQRKFDKLTLADPQIWSDPSKKFLDPANGIGNYPAMAFTRLMLGLKKVIPNEADRKKHILENMLYMCELNKKNIEVSRKVFDPEGVYALNLYQGSYLDLDPLKEWGVKKFDVIFGNPPYQMQVGPRKSQPIWNLFVLKSINLLSTNGYLVFVHPSGWRSPDGVFRAVYDKIMANNLIYLSMNSFKKGKELFNVGSNFDYYILQNSKDIAETSISDLEDKDIKVNLKNWKFIPSGGFDIYTKVLAFDNDTTVEVLYSRSLYGTDKANINKTKKDKFIHPCVYTITTRDGMNLVYSSVKSEHFGVPKVIWSNGLGTYPVIDDKGDYGLTQFSYAIVDTSKHLTKIKAAMNNTSFIKLMDYCKFTNNKYNYKVMRLFKRNFWKYFQDSETTATIEQANEIVYKEPVAQPVIMTTSIQPDYKKMKVADLKQLCKERKIKGITAKSKEELIAMLTT